MKHFAFIVCLSLLLVFKAQGQGFSNRIVDVRPAMQYSSIIQKDSVYYTLGVTTRMTPPYTVKTMWSRLDNRGLLQQHVAYEESDLNNYGGFFNTLFIEGDSLIKLFSYVEDTSTLYPALFTIGFDGSLKRKTVYADSNATSIRGDFITGDGNGNYYLGSVYQYQPGSVDAYLMKVDYKDSILWGKRYGALGVWDEYVTSLCYLKNGNIAVGSWKFDLKLPNMKSYTWLFEVDTSGAMVRQWFDGDSTMEAKGLKQTSDGGFVFASKAIQSQDIGDAFCFTTVVKLDSALNREWIWEGDVLANSFIGGEDIEELNGGGYIACGNGNYYNPQFNLLSAFILKLRSDGSLLWKNGYTAIDTPGAENFLNDIDVLPDGSYIAVGYVNIPSAIQPTQRQQAWILKVDSNGCVIDNCLVGIEEVSEKNMDVRVYPNPAAEYAVFESDGAEDLKIEVYDLLGKQMTVVAIPKGTRTVVDTHTWPNGIYTWQVINAQGKNAGQGKLSVIK